MRKAQQAAPLQRLTAANFINDNEKQILRAKTARRGAVLAALGMTGRGLLQKQSTYGTTEIAP